MPQQTSQTVDLKKVADLLGGPDLLRHRIRNPLDAHDLIVQGMPGQALRHLIDNFINLRFQGTPALEKAFGMSLRTVQRRKEPHSKTLTQEQSSRAWKFAEVLARATSIFGSQEEAEKWMARKAVALDQRRPIDLLATSAGLEIVEELLTRLEYGVYV